VTARQQELLACVALRGGEAVPRQEIAGRLWPESTDAQALTNLRREWHHLREAWPELDAVLDAGTRTLAWRPDALADLDVNSFSAWRRWGCKATPRRSSRPPGSIEVIFFPNARPIGSRPTASGCASRASAC
jgi:DNA-binding SARP family transcriptional activator